MKRLWQCFASLLAGTLKGNCVSTSVDDESTESTLAKHHREMREAVGEALIAWNAIENSLAHVLGYMLDPRVVNSTVREEEMIGYILYYRPNNTETRIALVDAAAQFAITAKAVFAKELTAIWENLHGRINGLKDVRNNIAHGNLVTVSGKGDKIHLRWSYAVFDVGRHRKKHTLGQLPGMPMSVITAHAKECWKRSGQIGQFRDALIHIDRFIKAATPGIPQSDFVVWQQSLQRILELQAADLNFVLPR